MMIDERLEALAERHEALAQGVESILAVVRENSENIKVFVRTAERDGENIRALGRIAEIHEHRLTHLEGGEI